MSEQQEKTYNIAENLERSRRLFPDKAALIFEGKTFAYREIDEMSSRLADGLSKQGFVPGDRIALFLPNIPEFITAYFGVQKLGAVAVVMNAMLKPQEAAFIIRDSGASAVLTTAGLWHRLHSEDLPGLKHCFIADGEAEDCTALSHLMSGAPSVFQTVMRAEHDPSAILYTSGTTGFPKGAVISHGNIIFDARTTAYMFRMSPEDRILLFSPLSHSFTLSAGLNTAINAGATIVLHRDFDPESVLRSVVDHNVTCFYGSTPVYAVLLGKASPEQMRPVRFYISGGAAMPSDLAEKWREKFGRHISISYGLTECSQCCFNHLLKHKIGSVGSPAEGVQIKIAGENRLETGPGKPGELLVRGPKVTPGYWNRPAETAEAIRDGWFHTGDIGCMDEDGYIFITDRKKDMINVGGQSVYPSEIENIICQHPAVAEAAVYGIPDPVMGEQVCASIVLKSGKNAAEKEMTAFCRERLADFKIPGRIEFAEMLPKAKSGKLLKRELREQAEKISCSVRKIGKERAAKRENDKAEGNAVLHRKNLTPESVREWIAGWLSRNLSTDSEIIRDAVPFKDYGMNSALAVKFALELGDWSGQSLPAVMVWTFPTIESVTAHLLNEDPGHQSFFEPNIRDDIPAENTRREPVAIIGMGCRFPGGADNPQSLWELLRQGKDAVTEIPESRWNTAAYYDPDPNASGKMYVKNAAFLNEPEQFDSQFFGIPHLEAATTDPQQRLLLEVAWEALEYAGIAPDRLRSSRTGVFTGVFWDDYSALNLYKDSPDQIDAYRILSNLRGMNAGRLAYVLGVHGPVMQLDTACSSSLLAVHLACQSLRNQECHLALAGGASLFFSPEHFIGLCRMRVLSPDGRCKTFDARADGFGLGEGCGIVVLKRLSDALRDRDNILAVIRGTAINHDGSSNGLTAPNGQAQEDVIQNAMKNAAVSPDQIQYVEAHGTGTELGDPLELAALANIFGTKRTTPLMIGSVKANIGHLSSAAGIASLIKVILSLRHKEIPPQLHFEKPNPYIPWHQTPFVVPAEPMPWSISDKDSRIAGISSFGMTGTNVHLIVSEAPQTPAHNSIGLQPISEHLLTLSAKTEAALSEQAARYADYLTAHPDLNPANICYTASAGRTHFDFRLAVTGNSISELQQKLENIRNGAKTDAVRGQTKHAVPKTAFLFTGQGSQYADMGLQLFETDPLFRQILEQCDQILKDYLKPSLLEVLYGDDKAANNRLLAETRYTQPALFAVEYALARLWQSWGIQPYSVMGHSIGEYPAACVAGIFSLEQGLRLIAERGMLMQSLPEKGGMLAVRASENQLAELLNPLPDQLAVAVLNAPRSIVLSGKSGLLEQAAEHLKQSGIQCKALNVSHAFHSPLMDPMLAKFEQTAGTVAYSAPRMQFVSNLTGTSATETDADYWTRHIRQPVRFAQGMKFLADSGADVFIEIGPKPILTELGQQCMTDDTDRLWLPSLYPNKCTDRGRLLESLGALYVRGAAIDWQNVDPTHPRKKIILPTYPFQRQHCSIRRHSDLKDRERIGQRPGEQFAEREAAAKETGLRQRLAGVSEDERYAILKTFLQKEFAQVTGAVPAEEQMFSDLGMDSLTAIQISNRLAAGLKTALSAALIFEYPTLKELIGFLMEKILNKTENMVADLSGEISRDRDIPLSFAQEELWFYHQRSQEAYSIWSFPARYHIAGNLDAGILEQSLNDLVMRHEILRTIFPAKNSVPVQQIAPEMRLRLPVADISHLSEQEKSPEAERLIRLETRQSLDMLKGPMWRPKLIRLDEKSHILVIYIHHILTDAASMDIFLEELFAFYEARINGEPAPLPPLRIQYADFVLWQRHFFTRDRLETRLEYYQNLLTPEPQVLELPADYPRTSAKIGPGDIEQFQLLPELTEKLESLSRQKGSTPFMTILAAFAALLYRCTGCEDIVAGVPMSRRYKEGTAQLIGFFSGQGITRADISGNPDFTELLSRVRHAVQSAIKNQDISYGQVMNALQKENHDVFSDHLPYRAGLDFLPVSETGIKRAGISAESVHELRRNMMLDLVLLIWKETNDTGSFLKGYFSFRSDLFESQTIVRMIQNFKTLLTAVAQDPEQPVESITLSL
jgi:acyl transferase domain-containing protein/acyl-CoA synthetase (AMP-forming)/AMP-acid ligase II